MKDYPVQLSTKPIVTAFFDEISSTVSYIVQDPNSSACAVFDSVLDMNYAAGRITYEHADSMIEQIKNNGLTIS